MGIGNTEHLAGRRDVRLPAARVPSLGDIKHQVDGAWRARGGQGLFEELPSPAEFHRVMPGRAEGRRNPLDRFLGVVFLQ